MHAYEPPPPRAEYPRVQTGWEDLKPDYSNVRGFNYVPVYPRLFDEPPDLPAHLTYRGSASPTATWRFWQKEDIDRQLGYLKGFGCNAVRVFLAHQVWEYEEQQRRPGGRNLFIDRFLELVALCEKHRMYLMPVLWDAFSPFGLDPGPVPYDDIDRWRHYPAHRDTNLQWAEAHRAADYVRAVCGAARDSHAIFLWDVMNEPDPAWVDWFAANMRWIREADPNPAHGITVGFAALIDFIENRVVADPLLDVVSYHPYGMFQENIDEWTRLARKHAEPPIADRRKPVLATEGGSPGQFSRYEDYFRQIRNQGVGFMPWVAVIDDLRGWLPFDNGTGIVFADGEVRDVPAVEALQRYAREDGVLQFQLGTVREKRDQEGWQTETPFYPGYGAAAAVRDLHPLRWPHRPTLRADNVFTDGYATQRVLLQNVLTWGLGLLTTRAGDAPRGLLSPEEEATVRHYFELFFLHDLFTGAQPWILFDPPRVDWARYTAFYTETGIAMWQVIRARGLHV